MDMPIGASQPNLTERQVHILKQIEKKLLWLSAWTIHNANHVRPNRDGLKVGGHQASCASSISILTALYMHVARPQDRIAVKPHAGPVFHAINYLFGRQTAEKLKGLRQMGGIQPYPSRTKDGPEIDFSTGSVGLGVAITSFAALMADYVRLHGLGRSDLPQGRYIAIAGLVGFLTVDLAFFFANSTKLFQGGWFPLLIGLLVFTVLSTWKRGRQILLQRLQTGAIALEPFVQGLMAHPPTRVAGTAVFLTASREGVPHALLHNLAHNKVLHERVIFLTALTEDQPYVPPERRVKVEDMGNGFYRIYAHYGFKDEPDVPAALTACLPFGLQFNMMQTSFFLSRETIISTGIPGMALWREHLFIAMARNAESAMSFFNIPTNRVIELGSQVEI